MALRHIRFLSLDGAVGCDALDALRTLSNICNEAFYENSKPLTAVSLKAPSCLIGGKHTSGVQLVFLKVTKLNSKHLVF